MMMIIIIQQLNNLKRQKAQKTNGHTHSKAK